MNSLAAGFTPPRKDHATRAGDFRRAWMSSTLLGLELRPTLGPVSRPIRRIGSGIVAVVHMYWWFGEPVPDGPRSAATH